MSIFTRTESFREFIRYYPMVSLIVSIHIILYLLTILPIFPNNWFFVNFSGVNLYIMEGEVWRLITPTFMHSGFSHMLFNSFSLILFGPALERMLGSGKFLFVYLFSGIIANLATLLLEPLTYTHVGSSGAIFGLFGYYIAIIIFRKKMMSQQNVQIILILSAVSIIMTFLQPKINIIAHLFGLLGGLLLGAIPYFNKKDLSDSIQTTASWASSQRKNISFQSPVKVLIWAMIIILAILGFWR
ncbi:rhomboid family intramembrane serine protease [Neobacillus cucumis]|uniref:rhomboid family intramembrane serine protease n=1 Tax=Neobacillus cucumis TaxID=1740721 RepID=UPI002852FA50|nr:rhomboid family intramembrane serine protease [Neobacillus cucumis]MDR4945005.1 rhomboid family intramembrane serine protease [Neobacillus cucumis]